MGGYPAKPIAERFWPKVDRDIGPVHPVLGRCWTWTARRDKNGYGYIGVGGKKGGTMPAHRLSWLLATGSSAGCLHVCHACDNPSCVNPAHLFTGTARNNLADMRAKGREARGYRVQGKLTNDNVGTISRLYQHGGMTQRTIARIFSISQSTVSDVLLGARRAA